MRRLLSVISVLCICCLLACCGAAGIQDTAEADTARSETGASETEQVPEDGSGTEREIAGASGFDWDRVQKEDPIFSWEDPYPGKTWNEIEGLSEDEMFALLRQRSAFSLAQRNYKAYYYFLSGKSECDARRLEKNRGYESALVYLGPHVYPDDIIMLTLPEHIVTFRVKGVITTSEKRSGDEATVEKDLAMGEPEEIEYDHILCEMAECLSGEWLGGPEFVFSTAALSPEFISELCRSGDLFMAYTDPVRPDPAAREPLPVRFPDGDRYEYSISADHCFALKDGRLVPFSSVADILEFEGRTPEELMEHVGFLREKYGTKMLLTLHHGDIL